MRVGTLGHAPFSPVRLTVCVTDELRDKDLLNGLRSTGLRKNELERKIQCMISKRESVETVTWLGF